MLSRVLKEVRIPFPDDFFPAFQVSPELQNTHHHTAYQLLHATLRDEAPLTRFHPAQQPDNWKLIGERLGLQLYRERGADRGSALQVMTIGSLPGTLEDVMWGLYAASHGSFKTQRSIMHKDFLDAAMLHVLEEDPFAEGDPGFTFRFTGLKWLACAPTGKLLHKRDVCWHEELGLMNDANGDEVGFMTMHSVRVTECPPFEQQGVKRSNVSVAYIFRDLGNGRTGVYMKGSHTVGGKSRSWSTDAVMVEMWLAMANVLECAQSKRLSKLVHGKEVFVASQTAKNCDICDQKLKMLKGGQNCKICGKNVCDRCRLTKLVYPSRETAAFPCSYFFCKRCLIDAKDQLYSKASRISFQSDLSSHRSNSPRYRSASQGPKSVYSSSSSTGSYRGGGGGSTPSNASIMAQRERERERSRMRAPSRELPQMYYSEVKLRQQLSPRSSTSTTFSARQTASSESSFSDPASFSGPGSYTHSENMSNGSYQNYQSGRSMMGSARSGGGPPMIHRNISGSSATSQPRSHAIPRHQVNGSFVSSTTSSAYEAEEDDDDGDDDDEEEDSSGLSESDEDREANVPVIPSGPRRLSPNADVLAKLRQIELYADDETGLVELPPSRRPSQPLPMQQQPISSSRGVQDDRLKYINTYQVNRDGGMTNSSGSRGGAHLQSSARSNAGFVSNAGSYATPESTSNSLVSYSSNANRTNNVGGGGGYSNAGYGHNQHAGYSNNNNMVGYANSNGYASNGYPAQPTAAGRAPPPPPPTSHLNEREQMMQRLMQINMAAEATYLMAKYNNANMADSNR
ncbi:hypothetical protein Gpo141_00005507 [Globisporangium polare]